ncbi:MAG: hypothetical protein ACTSRK_14405 [Promethearchaeota archaeon]
MTSKNITQSPPPQILRATPRKASILSVLGILMFISYSLLKYFFPELAASSTVLPVLLLITTILLLYGIYYFSDTLTKQKMLLLGTLGLIGGSILLYLYILFHLSVVLEFGILIIVLSLFLLVQGILLLFGKKKVSFLISD